MHYNHIFLDIMSYLPTHMGLSFDRWYYEKVNVIEAEKYLMDEGENGSFFVRKSAADKGITV